MLVYKLRKTILAVNYEGSQPVAITLSEGKVLTVPNNFTDLTGLIDIECEGKNMRLFAADLRDRGELVKAATQP